MYAAIADANEYVRNYYSSTNPLRAAWESLSDEDKQVLLNRAEQAIDSLPLRGCPLESGKAFPRTPLQETSMERARIAAIELALQSQDQEAEERYRLQSQGVKSYKIGDLSETFKDSSAGTTSRILAIVSTYLGDWLSGGYEICPTRIRR